jgi:uncharacterized membrane protein YgdD (TMEM256/DUF423 family)
VESSSTKNSGLIMFKIFIAIGGLNALIAVALGAFGAHGLEGKLSPRMLEVFETGVRYHFYHALGLIILGLVAAHLPESRLLKSSGWLMLAGIVLFSGSLYVLSMTGIKWLGAITPFGGMAFIVAWLLLVIAVLK